jgi:hypothetical protein
MSIAVVGSDPTSLELWHFFGFEDLELGIYLGFRV